MKKIIRKLSILCMALGIMFNLIQTNIYLSNASNNSKQIICLSEDDVIYPELKTVFNMMDK